MQFFTNVFDFKRWELLAIFIVAYLSIFYITNTFITNDAYYYSVLGSQLSSERVHQIISMRQQLMWLYYVAQPVMVLLKLHVIAAIIYCGGFLFNVDLSYKNAVKTVLLAEVVMVIQALSKTTYWLVYAPKTAEEVSNFAPLSVTQLINPNLYPNYFFYPLQLFNLFEVAYWLVLILGIAHFIKSNLKKSFSFVAATYGVGLLTWVLMVMFIKIQLS